jgi:aspartyl protease family protein
VRLIVPLAILAVAAVVLMTTPSGVRIAGLDHGAVAGFAGLVAMLAYLLAGARPSAVARMVSSFAVWAVLFALLAGVYAYRYDAADFFDRMTGELMPSEPIIGAGGEAIVARRLGGAFAVTAHINGARTTLIFDTGASMVVLTAADARRAGLNVAGLAYDTPVTTANGAAMAAQVRLDQISVGPIAMRKVSALVAKPGALEESLLGMSFLERLKSFTVERGKLVLTAK